MNLYQTLTIERVSKLINIKFRAVPAVVFLIVFIVNFLFYVVLGLLLGYGQSAADAIGVFDDWPNLVTTLVVIPDIWSFYAWLPLAISDVFSKAYQFRGLQKNSRRNYNAFINRLFQIANTKTYVLTAFAITIALTILAIFLLRTIYQPPSWYVHSTYVFWLIYVPILSLSMRVFTRTALLCFLTFYALNVIFRKFNFHIQPYDSDGAGGLAFIGKMSFDQNRISLFFVVFVINEVVAAITRGRGFFQVNIILEVIALPIFSLSY